VVDEVVAAVGVALLLGVPPHAARIPAKTVRTANRPRFSISLVPYGHWLHRPGGVSSGHVPEHQDVARRGACGERR
jgi:hypothetical protein